MSRVQLALNVDDLDTAIAFYSKLFATEPAKVRPGYANFAIAEPPLKLVLIEGAAPGGTLNHLGVEVESTDEVAARSAPRGVGPHDRDRRPGRVLLRGAGQGVGRRSVGRTVGDLHGVGARRDARRPAPHRRSRDRRDVLRGRGGRDGRRGNCLLLSDRRPIASPSVWRSRDLADDAAWTYALTPAERSEICRAVARAKALGRTRATLDARRLPVARLDRTHRRVGHDAAPRPRVRARSRVPGRRARARRRRARVRRLGSAARHAGEPGRRRDVARSRARSRPAANRSGGSAVLDDATPGLPHRRRRHHRSALPQRAKRGGESRIVSAAAVYNEILARAPPARRVVRADVLGSQRRAVSRARSRSSGCR